MNKYFVFILALFISNILFSQTSYIQVTGEQGLSVFLNNQFKGKTTIEYKGYIIENVTPGTNLIKIVKDGFTPFEEKITIKPGEVFAYKVKPFTKHVVLVSEEGNTGETEKKATIKTGKLVIQSVPIDIKITMPAIEGISNSKKTKDKWLADEIPAGNYKITFEFNQKSITKNIEIIGSETTSLFVNMLSEDFKTSNSLDEKNELERLEYIRFYKLNNFMDSLSTKYKVEKGLTESVLRELNQQANHFMSSGRYQSLYSTRYHYSLTSDDLWKSSGINSIYFNNGKIEQYHYSIICGKGKGIEVNEQYKRIVDQIKSTIPSEFLFEKAGENIEIFHPKTKSRIRFSRANFKNGRDGFLDIGFTFYYE